MLQSHSTPFGMHWSLGNKPIISRRRQTLLQGFSAGIVVGLAAGQVIALIVFAVA